MHDEHCLSRAEYLAALRCQAEKIWGHERLPKLNSILESTAASIWRLMSAPLHPVSEEPDFVGKQTHGKGQV